jgi:hypothetical protein
MEEVEEEWPVAKETQEEVWTSAVSLEPRTAEVPEIAMEDVVVEARTACSCCLPWISVHSQQPGEYM